jgi:hypothetical protein
MARKAETSGNGKQHTLRQIIGIRQSSVEILQCALQLRSGSIEIEAVVTFEQVTREGVLLGLEVQWDVRAELRDWVQITVLFDFQVPLRGHINNGGGQRARQCTAFE